MSETKAATLQEVVALMEGHAIGAAVVWSDKNKDLAILKPESTGPGRPLTLAPRRFVEQGDRVRAIGYPGINDNLGPSSILVLSQQPGEITSAYFHQTMGVPVYHISSNVYHGMSGGPLVNACGEVVGVDGPGQWQGEGADIDRAIYSIQVDGLIPILDEQKVAYTATSTRCAAESSSSGDGNDGSRNVPIQGTPGRDPLLTFGVIAALLLGVGALVLALTSRGRSVMKAAAEGVTERLGRKHKGDAGKGAGVLAPQPTPGPANGAAGGGLAPRHDAPTLYGVSGEYAGVELELSDEPVVIGRDPRVSQLVFSADTAGVSGRHCSIWFDPAHQTVLVQDLWSSHGTFLESGERLTSGEPRPLRSADQFYLADPEVLFEVRY